ncbi:MAG: phosphate ABC transporter substrate-binding protein PstS [Thermoguttaceae bacterium]|jgi:ABC-type phosphate transport system substrate-binding protein
MASLQNKAGKFVEPSIASGQNALAAVKVPDDLIVWASDPEGDESYPIVTYTWIIAYKKYADAKKGNALKEVLTYCLTDGQKESEALGYIPLPAKVRDKVQAALANIALEGDAKGETMLDGAGATFPKPLYKKWFKTYSAAHPEVKIGYLAVGSGPGVKLLMDENVDFGASDAAMTPEEIAKVERGVQFLPVTAGSIVLAYNLPGVDNLKLTRDAYVGIFLGRIKKWSDKAIADANPGVKLPDQDITVVTRTGGSGTTYVFTKHLSAISEEFAKSLGVSTQPKWPVGTKAKGNEGVATLIKSSPGSIGYLEYGYVTNGR